MRKTPSRRRSLNRTVRLHHLGFLFNADGTSAGTFVVEETDTLAAHGRSYVGTFTFRTYDVSGNFTGAEVKGTVASNTDHGRLTSPFRAPKRGRRTRAPPRPLLLRLKRKPFYFPWPTSILSERGSSRMPRGSSCKLSPGLHHAQLGAGTCSAPSISENRSQSA